LAAATEVQKQKQIMKEIIMESVTKKGDKKTAPRKVAFQEVLPS